MCKRIKTHRFQTYLKIEIMFVSLKEASERFGDLAFLDGLVVTDQWNTCVFGLISQLSLQSRPKGRFWNFLRLPNHDFAASSPIDFATSSPIDFAASSPDSLREAIKHQKLTWMGGLTLPPTEEFGPLYIILNKKLQHWQWVERVVLARPWHDLDTLPYKWGLGASMKTKWR